MLSGWFILLLVVGYLGLLFGIARYGDRRANAGHSLLGANIYALSLAVYCTSWTFYGSVGRASSGGLSFLTIYLGPTLMLLCIGVISKMIRIAKAQRITSIADFVAARYGKSQALAGLVTVISVIGIVPYIALQLKAVATSVNVLMGHEQTAGAMLAGVDPPLVVALLLAVFAVFFGTRHLDATERHEGMVAAVAFESLIKLLAFVGVGSFVVYGLYDGFADLFGQAAHYPEWAQLWAADHANPANWTALLLLSGLAIVFLPRQFQVMVVENVDEAHVHRAVWLFPLYLLLINIFVLPVALAGLLHFGAMSNPDMFVLALPLAQGEKWLALLVFIGGLSAATGMVIVESVALSTMVSNDLVMPLLLRSTWFQRQKHGDLSGVFLGIRRFSIFALLLLGYAYYRVAGEAYALVGIGLISFSAVAQFAPAVFGGMYWKQGNRAGAMVGLLLGFLVWGYTLLLPSFARSGWIDGGFVTQGLFGVSWLKAQALFGLQVEDEISHCLWWSLLLNFGAYVAVSLLTKPTALGASQAERFVDISRLRSVQLEVPLWRGQASSEALVNLLERFLGSERAHRQLASYASVRNLVDWRRLPADSDFVHFAENELAGAIGSASARVVVASVIQEESLGLEEVMDILDEASRTRAHSQALEAKQRELEAATTELRSANERLRELDRLKDDFVSTVTHELRTPLTSIRALSEMLHDDPRINLDDRQRFLGIVVTEADRLTRLINQILDMAKLESGRAEWMAVRLDVGGVIREVVATMEALFSERGVRLTVELPEQGLVVLADRDRLTQVLVNLLSNAVKFVPANDGLVRVLAMAKDGMARVEIIDNGPGLTYAECNVIFDKFRQGGNTLTSKPQGTGLGLPISRQIVECIGGKLWVESQPGEGAAFIFTVPLAAPEE